MSPSPSRRRSRRRSRQAQLSLAAHGSRGGYRAGAGRKPKREGEHKGHVPRRDFPARFPIHVTLRIRPGVESLRRGRCIRILRGCFFSGKERFGFRLVHFSVQSNHIHLICEADDRRALSRGIQGLAVRIARRLNRQLERKGRLFAQR